MKRWLLVFTGCILLCAGCVRLTPTGPSHDAGVDSPGESPVPERTLPIALPSHNENGEETDSQEDVDRLRQLVASELGVEQETLMFIELKPEVWRDASLGCPEPGMVYAQILTEGWLVVFQNTAGELINVHAERGFDNFIICDDGASLTSGESSEEGDSAPVVRAAVQYIVEKLGYNEDEVTVNKISTRMWPNSCLGCPEKEEMCLAVMTHGYQLQVTVNGTEYSLHTDDTGSAIRLCK